MRRLLLVLTLALVMAAMVGVTAAPAMASPEELLVPCNEVIRTADTGSVFCSGERDEFSRAPTFECEETFRLKGRTFCPIDADDAFKLFVIDEKFKELVGPLR